jgi:hypothetical protein
MKNALVLVLLLAAVAIVVPALAADDAAAGLPDGFKGFRGLLKGTVVSKADGQFVLKVDSVVKTFPPNKATKPEVVVAQQLTIKVTGDKLLHALAERKVDEVVIAGVFNDKDNNLVAIEQIQKAPAEKAAPK